MVLMTMIARVADGLLLVASMQENEEVRLLHLVSTLMNLDEMIASLIIRFAFEVLEKPQAKLLLSSLQFNYFNSLQVTFIMN